MNNQNDISSKEIDQYFSIKALAHDNIYTAILFCRDLMDNGMKKLLDNKLGELMNKPVEDSKKNESLSNLANKVMDKVEEVTDESTDKTDSARAKLKVESLDGKSTLEIIELVNKYSISLVQDNNYEVNADIFKEENDYDIQNKRKIYKGKDDEDVIPMEDIRVSIVKFKIDSISYTAQLKNKEQDNGRDIIYIYDVIDDNNISFAVKVEAPYVYHYECERNFDISKEIIMPSYSDENSIQVGA